MVFVCTSFIIQRCLNTRKNRCAPSLETIPCTHGNDKMKYVHNASKIECVSITLWHVRNLLVFVYCTSAASRFDHHTVHIISARFNATCNRAENLLFSLSFVHQIQYSIGTGLLVDSIILRLRSAVFFKRSHRVTAAQTVSSAIG